MHFGTIHNFHKRHQLNSLPSKGPISKRPEQFKNHKSLLTNLENRCYMTAVSSMIEHRLLKVIPPPCDPTVELSQNNVIENLVRLAL